MQSKELKNELNWSHSRMRTFEGCRRQYYYQYYLKWHGWSKTSTPERQQAYRLSKMTSFDLETGNVVHDTIAQVLEILRKTGRVYSQQDATRNAVGQWDIVRSQSLSGNWRKYPGTVKNFLEDYYEYPGCEERSESKRAAIETHIGAFFQSKTWEQIQRLKTGRWLAMDTDKIEAKRVHGIPMYGRPDLALSSPHGEKPIYRLFDWKTGSRRESDSNQLGFYALYASVEWQCRADEIIARLVYLRDPPSHVDVPVSAALIEGSFDTMTTSYEAMRSVLKDPDANVPLPIEAFPQNQSHRSCPRCNFQELCFGGKWQAPADPDAAADDDDEI